MEKLGIRLIRFSSSTNFSHRSWNRTYTRGNSSLRVFILSLSLSLEMNSYSVCYTRSGWRKKKKKKEKRSEAENGIIERREGRERGKVWSVVAPRRKKTMEKSRWRWLDEKGGGRGFDRGTQERNERTDEQGKRGCGGGELAAPAKWIDAAAARLCAQTCARVRTHLCIRAHGCVHPPRGGCV